MTTNFSSDCTYFIFEILDMNPKRCRICKNVLLRFLLNMSYLTDSYIVFTLKMESVSKNTIFGLNKDDGKKWPTGLSKSFQTPKMCHLCLIGSCE